MLCKWETDCAWCELRIRVSDDMYIIDGAKVCWACAHDRGYLCPNCHRMKKPEYKTCTVASPSPLNSTARLAWSIRFACRRVRSCLTPSPFLTILKA